MDFAIKIAALISLSAFAVLCLSLLFTLSKFSKLIGNANALLHDINLFLIDIKKKVSSASDQINDVKARLDGFFAGVDELKEKAIQSLNITDDTFIQGKKTALLLEKELDKLSQTMEPYHMMASKLSSKVVPPVKHFSNFLTGAKKMVGGAISFPLKLIRNV